MAQFMGTVEGSRGAESRLGTKNSGMEVRCMSYAGVVKVVMSHHNGADVCRVELRTHPASGNNLIRVLFDGPVAAFDKESVTCVS